MTLPARLLVPLDLSSPGEAKLGTAEEYARAFGAEVILLHALPPRGAAAAIGELRPSRRREAAEAAENVSPEEAAARTYLDALAARLRSAGIVVQTLVRIGPVAPTVLAVAREEGVGLIVIGSNVRPTLSRVILGNVSEAIVRGAPCPTLLVRPALDSAAAEPAVRSFADDATRAGLIAPRTLGERTVDVARIIGSVGRAAELDADFKLLHRSEAVSQRYQAIRNVSAGEGGKVLPPIDLYKLGYGYYVLDGHRRVAAAKELGQDEIEANVTEFVPVDDATAQRLFAARRAFERATGLTRIGATRPETYARLQDLIADWVERHEPGDRREGAARWYSKVFRPQTKRIRALRLKERFPGERSADLLVRLADHRRAEAERQGHKVSWEEALASFAAAPRAGEAEGHEV